MFTLTLKNGGIVDESDVSASGRSTPSGTSTPVSLEERPTFLADFLINKLKEYQQDHLYKFLGAGINEKGVRYSPHLPSRLWQELDIVPLVLKSDAVPDMFRVQRLHNNSQILVDEEADSMARKALMYVQYFGFFFGVSLTLPRFFGPTSQPRLAIGFRNMVEVDCSGRAAICDAGDYPGTVSAQTWQATIKYAESLKKNKVQIAFFNSTPQGGGVALMRHALIRFLRTLGVDCSW